MKKIAIIGAGKAGLTAAHHLKDIAQISLFEKSRGLGGRLSTRREEPYFFDHGAQYFTAKSEAFKKFLQPLIQKDVIKPWHARVAQIENRQIIEIENWGEDHPRYVGAPAMNAIGKFLADGLDIHRNIRIEALHKDADYWTLIDQEKNAIGPFDWVLSAMPAPQMLALFPPDFSGYGRAQSIEMQACFALMLGFKTPLPLEFDAAQIKGEDIGWVAMNHTKPDREGGYCLVIHSSNDWAQAHIDDDREEVQRYLCRLASNILGHDLESANFMALHGWRYANALLLGGLPYMLDENLHLAACGDWCVEGKVEGAFQSGHELANKIKQFL
ncbi:MAG: NAD(P)/FAD-dependent oxidoreductase [Alphaproteobacteria bacterium]